MNKEKSKDNPGDSPDTAEGPVRVAVDLTQVPLEKTGIGIYALNLTREMIRLNREHPGFIFYFFVQDDDHEFIRLIRDDPNSRLVTIRAGVFRKLPLRFVFEQILFPRRCRKLNIDVIFSLHYTMPCLTGIRRVVMIPDMTFYLFPDMHRKIKRLYFKSLIPLSLRRSWRVLTISESARSDMLQRFNYLDPAGVEAVHLGVTGVEGAEGDGPGDPPVSLGVEPGKYFLFVGTLEPRKNIPALIGAFHDIAGDMDSDYKLVIVGKKGWYYEEIFATVKKLNLCERVVFTGYVDDQVKQRLLAGAYGFVYPSFYEGFGLPVLEAMVYGVPVITGNVSSLPEVSGDAALLVPPDRRDALAAAMKRLLTDPGLYAELSEKGRRRARQFTWRRTAEQTMDLLQRTGRGG